MKAQDVLELYALLREHGVQIWIDGGWGIDALLERQTRPHKDLDAFVAFADLPTMTMVLSQRGFVLKEIWSENRWLRHAGHVRLIGTDEMGSEVATAFVLKDTLGHEIDVHVLHIDEYGYGTPAWDCSVSFSSDALMGSGMIAGSPVQCLSAAMHMRTHTGYQLQDKDMQDLRLLHERFAIEYSEEHAHQIQQGGNMAHSQPQGFLAVPTSGQGPDVLVLHAWWGLNDTIKAFCTRLAEAGFVTFAPDLYHGKVADTIPNAEALGGALDANHLQAKAEIREAVEFLNEQPGNAGRGLAVIGFSLGAYYALDLANSDPEHIRCVVVFYGTGADDFSDSQAEFLGHFAENDEFEPQANVDHLEESLRRAGRPVTFYRYSGTGHWFFEPDRSDAYNREAASLAWDRTLAFLKHSTNS